MLTKLVQIDFNEENSKFTLKEIFVNPRHVVKLEEVDKSYFDGLDMPEGLDPAVHSFSFISLEGKFHTIVVVGSPEQVSEKLSKKQILHG